MSCRTLLSLVLFAASTASGDTVRLSPEGAISSPQAALEAARKITERPVRILVARGDYPLSETLTLGPGDSGISWEADQGSAPVFTGGRSIDGWKKSEDGTWQAEIPEVREGKWDFSQLWIDGRRATPAREPDRGFFHIEAPLSPSTFEGVESAEYEGFVLPPEVFGILQAIPERERAHVLLTVPHSWSAGQCRIEALDPSTRSVRIRGKARYGFLARGPDQRIWMEGFRAACDEPGEWHLDRASGILRYLPLPEEDFTGECVVAPMLDQFVKIAGAENVSFRGIAFRFGQYLFPEEGLHDGQAAVKIDGAIEVEDSRGIRFLDCEIGHVGRHAIFFRDGNSDCVVSRSHLHDLGGGGVRIGTISRPEEERICRNIVVEDCIIQQGGRLHPSACGVTLTHGRDCAVRHCDIGDFYYTGVSFGWNWGYGESVNRRNRLENCRIHHIGWAYLSDMGAFYNLGNAPETVIRGNHIHHVACYDYGGWGLYNDEGSGDVLMENNLVHDTSSAGFHQHYGYANRVRNNIFAFGGEAQIRRSRNEPRLTMVFENNIVLWDPGIPLLKGPVSRWENWSNREKGDPAGNAIFRRNLYWRTDGKMPEDLVGGEDSENGLSWETWREWGRDRDSRFADPAFVDAKARDFRLAEESPALELGFLPWDHSEAGVRGEEWRKVAARAHLDARWEKEARPWPRPEFRIDLQTFENVPAGEVGIQAGSWDDQGKGESIGVIEGVSSTIPLSDASGGDRSLRIVDVARLEPSYHPILDVHPTWEEGVFRISFDVMSEPESSWFFEIRGSGPFAAGPYLKWEKGRITAGHRENRELALVPPGEWVRIEVTAATGSERWMVELVREDGSTHRVADIPCQPEWTDGSYLLWSAIGSTKSAFFLDNLRMVPEVAIDLP